MHKAHMPPRDGSMTAHSSDREEFGKVHGDSYGTETMLHVDSSITQKLGIPLRVVVNDGVP